MPVDVVDAPPVAREDAPAQLPGKPAPLATKQDREQAIERARHPNPNAFAPWTREEEAALKERHVRGVTFADMARAQSIGARDQMRLLRLGLIGEDEI